MPKILLMKKLYLCLFLVLSLGVVDVSGGELSATHKKGSGEAPRVQYNINAGAIYLFNLPDQTYQGTMGGPPAHVYTSGVGPTLEFTVGTRLNSCVLIGGELSLTPRIKNKYQWNPLINIAPHAKFYIPTSKEHVSPYVNLSIGAGSLACVEWGLYTNIGLGVEIKRFNVLAGYRGYAGKFVSLYESDGASLSSAIYLQLGVRLGK